MKKEEIKPLVTGPSWQKGDLNIFYLPSQELEVRAPRSLINQLVKLCNGQRTLTEVTDEISKSWDRTSVVDLIDSLIKNCVICDSSSLARHFWPYTENPTAFGLELSDTEILQLVSKAERRNKSGRKGEEIPIKKTNLTSIIEKRISTRTFSSEKVAFEIIAQMLWAGYGIVKESHFLLDDDTQKRKVWQGKRLLRHTVPSAGALYPIRISLILLRPTGKYSKGIYDVHFKKHDSIELLTKERTPLEIIKSFADQMIFNKAQGIIVVSGSFGLSGTKYGNRSMLYVTLEAGHVAQNIHLAAVENNIGTVEIGGFLEKPMKKALRLPESFWPLTTILFGKRETLKKTIPKEALALKTQWAYPFAEKYKVPFSMVFVQPDGEDSEEWSCGRSRDPEIAIKKAVSEAYEWKACNKIPNNLVRAPFKELAKAIDPRTIVAYHNRQYLRKNFPLKCFEKNHQYDWVKGNNVLSNKQVYILAQCVYFPYPSRNKLYTWANSSGAAAHIDKGKAIQHATLELVERDAFMIAWLNRLQLPAIAFNSLPNFIQKRIRVLRNSGFRVIVKNFTLDLAPVIFVFLQNKNLTTTICAACSSFDTLRAIDHALEEAEASAYCRLRNKETEYIKPRDVHRTFHHGSLYEQPQYFQCADFLAKSKIQMKFTDIAKKTPKNWNHFLRNIDSMGFQLLTVKLGPVQQFSNYEIPKIEKVFIPGIVPISFGFGLEPCGMERIYNLPIKLGYRASSLRFSELTKFPHPYT